jgi:ribosome biogenesis SPOUT family RNA methylase Rps3
MRAKEVLSPNDKSFLRVFIFGGILGDHPPRDRTKALREYCPTLRHMG